MQPFSISSVFDLDEVSSNIYTKIDSFDNFYVSTFGAFQIG